MSNRHNTWGVDVDDADPWGGWGGYFCEWCDGYQFVPLDDDADGFDKRAVDVPIGEPITAGRRWVCATCAREEPWEAMWTAREAAIRRVR